MAWSRPPVFSALFFQEVAMKKAVLFFLCLMLTGCAPAQPGGSLGEESSSAQQQSS